MVNATIKNRKIKVVSKPEVRRVIIEVLREIYNDPDYGLPLTPYIIKRLKKSMKSKKSGRLISFEEILKKYK